MRCRHCGHDLEHIFLDLGFAPPSNAYISEENLSKPEVHYPLKTLVCNHCWLVQTEDFAAASEMFDEDYAYFSSTSSGWLAHARQYVEDIAAQLALDEKSFVLEVASNDGYLLKNFVAAGIPCLGVEPTASTAEAAEKIDIPVIKEFFGEELAQQLATQNRKADLIIGNNVYAHVPDINDFTKGLKQALKPGGTITLEFPHLANLINENQFDTIYHEHFSYLSLGVVCRIFETFDLKIWNVQTLPTHGGSVRIYAGHKEEKIEILPSVGNILAQEERLGLFSQDIYQSVRQRAEKAKLDLLEFLLKAKKGGKKVAAYGAAAKGNTLLNFSGIKPDLLPVVYDAAPSKQGKFMPSSHIPIKHPDQFLQDKPDYLLILPWNIAPEIMKSKKVIKNWGGKFVTAIPELIIHEVDA